MSNNTGLTREEDVNKLLDSFYKEFAKMDWRTFFKDILQIKAQEQFKSLLVANKERVITSDKETITDLENRIRELEVDVTVKERIRLEKEEETTPNNTNHTSEDVQFYEATDSLAGSESPTKDKIEDFDNLNKKFSERIIVDKGAGEVSDSE
ncbi:hypothetical protein C1646_764208 [Rhizophagus diaphanus]|nr:hypothetical protein C1646_764208 [Rhizophagus diaphanus] [Rhizophagus sp. MUCL 43196]